MILPGKATVHVHNGTQHVMAKPVHLNTVRYLRMDHSEMSDTGLLVKF